MTKPVEKFAIGRVQTSVWKNEGKDGAFFTAKIEHNYKSGDEWKPTNSYNARELLHLAKSALKAHSIIGELAHGEGSEEEQEEAA